VKPVRRAPSSPLRLLAGGAVAAALLACGAGAAGSATGWQFVRPGGKTGCAHGGRFGFWARLADPRKLLVFFEGGGGCYSYRTCAPGSTWFDPVVNHADSPGRMLGIFDLANPRNTFRDWSAVVVPSCTGDVFIGSTDHTYRQGRLRLLIRHRGWYNGEAALRWAFAHVEATERVLVAGSSAGSVGSAFHAPEVIAHYGASHTSQLGDSLAFVFPHPLELTEYHGLEHLPSWLRGDPRLRPGRFTMVGFLARMIAHYPRTTFARFDFRADEVQARFYAADGGKVSAFPGALLAAERQLHAKAPRYRSFLECGRGHTILPLYRFFLLRAVGVSLRDWTARIAAGRPVRSLACRA
jgi:Pectinacetylesterase